MNSLIPVGLLLSLASPFLYPEEFRFIQEEGTAYRIVSEVQQGVWENDNLIYQSTILNRIGVKILEADEGGAQLEASYSIAEKSLETDLYTYTLEGSQSFYRSALGLYEGIGEGEYLPSVRHVPTFPGREITPGEGWTAPGLEVHDLMTTFGIAHRITIPYRVFYTYQGSTNYKGKTVDVILISYNFVEAVNLPYGLDTEDPPNKVSGTVKQRYLWDRSKGIPAAVEGEFEFIYQMQSGTTYVFRGTSKGEVVEAVDLPRSELFKIVEGAAAELPDVSVDMAEQGVTLTLENILFQPDSAQFLPGEELKLKKLKEFLLSIPGYDLMVTGHTAEVPNSTNDDSLSQKRAAAVASYLLDEGVRQRSQMIIQGKGSSEPLGDNSTEEGRQKNRRVEITILEN